MIPSIAAGPVTKRVRVCPVLCADTSRGEVVSYGRLNAFHSWNHHLYRRSKRRLQPLRADGARDGHEGGLTAMRREQCPLCVG